VFSIIAINNVIYAVACVRKYLVAASLDPELASLVRRGMIDNIIISRSIHIHSLWEISVTIIVPDTVVQKIIINIGKWPITMGRVENSIFQCMDLKFYFADLTIKFCV
jgi:hypothetical protein